MDSKYYVEVSSSQRNHFGEYICGDVFISKRLKAEGRLISVLADGMGHGVKANVLGTLTASMALNFAEEHKDAQTIGNIIMRTLPVCSERKISYATFTIIDVDNGEVSILEYDNPLCLVMRGANILEIEWEELSLESLDSFGRSQEIKSCKFIPEKEDRIVFISDGVTQSGMGSGNLMLGWTRENYVEFVKETIIHERHISASKLAQRVVNKAYSNDNFKSKDDTSCGVIYFRDARKTLIATGPPFNKESDKEYAQRVKNFDGKKILCGATTTDIISREWGIEVEDYIESSDPTLPPMSKMEGIDLVTEGILTLNKVVNILSHNTESTLNLRDGPADRIIKLLLDSDEIVIMVGTKINQAHHDPSLGVEIEIRRTTIKRLEEVLEKKFMKEVIVQYI
jgi:hypothetical protein